MNSFWHLHGIVADYPFQNAKHSRVFLSLSRKYVVLRIIGKQQKLTWQGSKFTYIIIHAKHL